jgi:hypothetical protein
VNDGLTSFWKEVVVFCFDVLSWPFLERTEKDDEKFLRIARLWV